MQVQVGYDMTLSPACEVPEAVEVPAGYAVKVLSQADAGALEKLCATEFPGWQGMSGSIGAGPNTGVAGVFDVATGELAAFAGFDEYIFFSTGTAVKYRRKGLGSVVFWTAVKRLLVAMPETPIVIGCANLGFYARAFGCYIRGTVWRMQKDLTADQAISKGK